jgi:hypothetical protein
MHIRNERPPENSAPIVAWLTPGLEENETECDTNYTRRRREPRKCFVIQLGEAVVEWRPDFSST